MWKTFLLLMVSAVLAVAAPISFSLVQSNLTGSPGDTVIFQYLITNNSGLTILPAGINADSFTGGTPDASAFDAFGFGGIADGASRQGSLFAFASDPAVPSSFNRGTFGLLVIDTNSNVTELFADYTVSIGSPVPEPSTWGAMLLGGCFLLWRRLRPSPVKLVKFR